MTPVSRAEGALRIEAWAGEMRVNLVRLAALLGVSVRTLQDWVQGRRAPNRAARTLLMIAAKNPKALLDVA